MDRFVNRKIRHSTDVEAHIVRADGSCVRGTLSEMSDEGCRIESDHPLPIGEQVRIQIPRMGQMRAKIRWSIGGACGARFDKSCQQ